MNTVPAGIASASRDANGKVTINLTAPRALAFGQTVTIAGIYSDPSFNGTLQILSFQHQFYVLPGWRGCKQRVRHGNDTTAGKYCLSERTRIVHQRRRGCIYRLPAAVGALAAAGTGTD